MLPLFQVCSETNFCVLVTADLRTLLYSRKNSNHSVWHAKHPAQSNRFSLSVKFFNNTRKHYFHANTMKDLFENVHMYDVLLFLKETGLYQKI